MLFEADYAKNYASILYQCLAARVRESLWQAKCNFMNGCIIIIILTHIGKLCYIYEKYRLAVRGCKFTEHTMRL